MLNAPKTIGPGIVAGLAALQLLTGCKKPQGGPAGGMPPVQVIAVEAKRQPVTEALSLVGSIAAGVAYAIAKFIA